MFNFNNETTLNSMIIGLPENSIKGNFMSRLLGSHDVTLPGEVPKKFGSEDMKKELNLVFSLPGFSELVDSISSKVTNPPSISPGDATVTFLGTGSAIPSKYRNGTIFFLLDSLKLKFKNLKI
jgi:hypothetical protein